MARFTSSSSSSSRRAGSTLSSIFVGLLLLAIPVVVKGQGDYPCTKQADCPAYGDGSNDISANSQCVADPAAPSFGYCGYAGATCKVSADCDYGRCESGVCRGYLGDTCSTDFDCMAYLLCGEEGKCGGKNARCVNGDADCISNKCNTVGTTTACEAPPSGGIANGQACGNNAICASGFCSGSYVCAVRPAGASQRARSRRSVVQNVKQLAKLTISERLGLCPRGLQACLVGRGATGFECINPEIDLESCGGCLHDADGEGAGAGTDCTALPNVDSVLCVTGKCQILSCLPGFTVDPEGKGCF